MFVLLYETLALVWPEPRLDLSMLIGLIFFAYVEIAFFQHDVLQQQTVATVVPPAIIPPTTTLLPNII